ncbi:MAG: TauD/TfdA family dioxygenase [Gammaproteobacteria bacterium]|nr:TauD/TfdA family dioxygenase [Gammaproteobacteria bacterium]
MNESRARTRLTLPKHEPGRIIDDATVWSGRDYPDDRSWVRPLDDAMRAEIVAAMGAARERGIKPTRVTEADFPLERTRALLAEIHRALECGPGFAMLSGFPLDGLDEDEVRLAYCGLCSHLGTITLQNREGEYLLEVTDKGKGYDRQSRGYHSSAHLDFHNDGTNTVTLLCVETAAEGGESMLVSGPAVYNAFVRERPELLDVLHRGFHHHRRDQRAPGEAPVTPYRTPVFGFRDGLFHLAYTGPSIRFCEDEGIEITARERAALDHLESILARPEMPVSMALRRGDLQLVNNFLVLHARTAYRDSPTRRRRLLRLWLDDEESARLGPGKMDWYLPGQSRFTRMGGIATLEH